MDNNFGLIHDASELRNLILENPDLPIVVLVGDEANHGDYSWEYCMHVNCKIVFILDVRTPYDRDTIFTDRDDFEEEVSDYLWNKETSQLSESEYDAMVKAEVSKYDPYWKKVIAIYANN